MYFVIGSGPAGIACAYALVAAGHKITIIDAGVAIDAEREAVRTAVAQRDKEDWTLEEMALLKGNFPNSGKVPLKLVNGSDYPYRSVAGATDIRYSGLNVRASYAQGGLSNVWGGAVLPCRANDIADWPIALADLAESYTEVLKIIPMAAEDDGLSKIFPLYTRSPGEVRCSSQIANLMRALKKNQPKLNADGVTFGRARLAIDALGSRKNTPCIYCGYCLHGCPRDLVYSSRQSLQALIKAGSVDYRPGMVVRSVEEVGKVIRINAVNRDGSRSQLEAERVFLGTGILSSTAILLRTLGMYERPVRIQDSQYYLFPLLQSELSPDVAEERLHTLSQAFVEIHDTKISPYTIHLQVYSYSDHLADVLKDKLGNFVNFFPRNWLLGRLLLVQGYLHSSHSGSILATLKRNGESDALFLEPSFNSATHGMIRQVLQKLIEQTRRTRAIPLSPLLQVTEPGRGFHSGGSFPMAASPAPGQTDRLGRPYGMQRTHVVDATIFPTIPATTITLTAMANAYRIGSEVAKSDSMGML